MPATGDTPKAARGFKYLQRTFFSVQPRRVSDIVLAGKRLRALTSTRHRYNGSGR